VAKSLNPIVVEEETIVENKIIVEKEMGYGLKEFLNQFNLFAKEINYTLSGNTINIDSKNSSNANSSVTINLLKKTDRTIGSLIIPRLWVQFIFTDYIELEKDHFLKKFDISFQRGGG